MVDETIRERLLKIKALYEKATSDGERQAAKAKLEQLLKSHGITIEELESPLRELYWFSYTSNFEHRFLVQLFGKVTGWKSKTVEYKADKRKRRLYFELTAAENADMLTLYAFYRKEWHQAMEEFFLAWLSKQGLGRPAEADEKLEVSLEDLAKLVRVRMMMKSVQELQSPLAAGYLPAGG